MFSARLVFIVAQISLAAAISEVTSNACAVGGHRSVGDMGERGMLQRTERHGVSIVEDSTDASTATPKPWQTGCDWQCYLDRYPIIDKYCDGKLSCAERYFNKTSSRHNQDCTCREASFEHCDWTCYLDRYRDLGNAFKHNVGLAKIHYDQFGYNEGRDCTCPTTTAAAATTMTTTTGGWKQGPIPVVAGAAGMQASLRYDTEDAAYKVCRADSNCLGYGWWNLGQWYCIYPKVQVDSIQSTSMALPGRDLEWKVVKVKPMDEPPAKALTVRGEMGSDTCPAGSIDYTEDECSRLGVVYSTIPNDPRPYSKYGGVRSQDQTPFGCWSYGNTGWTSRNYYFNSNASAKANKLVYRFKICKDGATPAPATRATLKNLGKECWLGCARKQGRCGQFCGAYGYCCRYGWHDKGNGCNGFMGVPGMGHVCTEEAPACPPTIEVTGAEAILSERMGTFTQTNITPTAQHGGRVIYKKGIDYLYYSAERLQWQIGSNYTTNNCFLHSTEGAAWCPTISHTLSNWSAWDKSAQDWYTYPLTIQGTTTTTSWNSLDSSCMPGGVRMFAYGQRCWYMSLLGDSCRNTCAFYGKDVSYYVPKGPLTPRILGRHPSLKQGPWAAFECYAPDGDRYHPANPEGPGANNPDWSYSTCRLSCPCQI